MNQNEFQDHVIDSLARLETKMTTLVGNGRPGRVDVLEQEVGELKKARWRRDGLVAGVSTTAATIASMIVHLLKH